MQQNLAYKEKLLHDIKVKQCFRESKWLQGGRLGEVFYGGDYYCKCHDLH